METYFTFQPTTHGVLSTAKREQNAIEKQDNIQYNTDTQT